MQEFEEKRLLNEINSIMEDKLTDIKKSIKQISNNNEYRINIIIPKNMTFCPMDIICDLYVEQYYPFNPPKLYINTNFIIPSLCDGRDFTEDVLGEKWSPNFCLEDIILKLPKFIINYNELIKEGYIIFVGKYYLNKEYNLNNLENLSNYTKIIKYQEIINNKTLITNKFLLISDINFCLFDIDKKNKNLGTLIFWSNLKALITLKRNLNENSIKFYFKNKLIHQKLFELTLITNENSDEIINCILGKMKWFGINYNISKKNLNKKLGKIPNTDIEMVENQIEEYEKKIENDVPTIEITQFLMTLYEKAIEFYSAINDTKYKIYMQKLNEILKSESMIEFMKKTKIEEKKNEDNINKKEKDNKFDNNNKLYASNIKISLSNENDNIEIDDEEEEEEEEEEEVEGGEKKKENKNEKESEKDKEKMKENEKEKDKEKEKENEKEKEIEKDNENEKEKEIKKENDKINDEDIKEKVE